MNKGFLLLISWVFLSAASPCFLVIHVDAPHLDYTSGQTLVHSLAKKGRFGHAWIYLQGYLDGELVYIEGGHSGELGTKRPTYFHGVMDAFERGESNPIAYLWTSPQDGFFQIGPGKHKATFSLKIEITQSEFLAMYSYIRPSNYSYAEYSLTGKQCCSFVAEVASFAGLQLEHRVTVPVEPRMRFRGTCMRLWEDPAYSTIMFSSVDRLEQSLKQLSN